MKFEILDQDLPFKKYKCSSFDSKEHVKKEVCYTQYPWRSLFFRYYCGKLTIFHFLSMHTRIIASTTLTYTSGNIQHEVHVEDGKVIRYERSNFKMEANELGIVDLKSYHGDRLALVFLGKIFQAMQRRKLRIYFRIIKRNYDLFLQFYSLVIRYLLPRKVLIILIK